MQTYVRAGLLEEYAKKQAITKGIPMLSAPLHVGFPRRMSEGQDSIISIQLRDRFNKGLAKLKVTEPQLFSYPLNLIITKDPVSKCTIVEPVSGRWADSCETMFLRFTDGKFERICEVDFEVARSTAGLNLEKAEKEDPDEK